MVANRATKRLNVMGSFFHAKSLTEAYALAGGNLLRANTAIQAALRQFHNGGLGDEIDLGMRAGLRVSMPEEVSSQAMAQVGRLADLYAGQLLGKKVTKVESTLKALEEFQEKTFDKFTWDYLHTGMKVDTYLRMMEQYKIGKVGKGIPEEQFRQGAASFVNDTFGGLDWYRLVSEAKTEAGRRIAQSALKPSARDVLGIAFFAPDWTLSTLRAMTKALPGGAKNPANAQLAKRYAMRTAVMYLTIMQGLNFAASGHFTWDNDDPTRIDLGDGTTLQFAKHSMEATEWARDPWKTFGNKMGFIPRTTIALQTGKQYTGGPPIESRTSYVAGQVLPFTARSLGGELDPYVTMKRSVMSMFGMPIYGMTEEEKEASRQARLERKQEKESQD